MELFTKGYAEAMNFCKERGEKKMQTAVFTPNAEMLVRAAKNRGAEALLSRADLLLPDGIFVHLALKVCKRPPLERTCGIDFAERYLSENANETSLFILGGKPRIASKAAEHLKQKYPALTVAGTHHGYFDGDICDLIDRSGADTVFVCMGFPRQERWIAQNLSTLKNIRLAIGLGGSADVWSGSVKRCPKILRIFGLEWLYRIASEPKRLSRLPTPVDIIAIWRSNLLKNR